MALRKVVDLRREHQEAYSAHEEPRIFDAGRTWCVTLTGRGDPEEAAFREAAATLRALVQRLKKAARKSGRDFKVMPLECVFWSARKGLDLSSVPPASRHWRLLVRVPQFVGAHDLALACAGLEDRRATSPARAVKIEWLEEGRCAQALHVGGYADEGATIERMRGVARGQGLALGPPRHEIYLSETRRLIRLPVAGTGASRPIGSPAPAGAR